MGTSERFIVCGVDGSAAGQRALQWALEEAARRGVAVHAVTAWVWDGIEALGVPSTPKEALEQARAVLDRAVDEALSGMDNPPDVERVAQRGEASDALCVASAEAELMVLGSHGHGTAHDKLVGSTSERAIHHAVCPVVIIPDPRLVERNLKRARSHVRK